MLIIFSPPLLLSPPCHAAADDIAVAAVVGAHYFRHACFMFPITVDIIRSRRFSPCILYAITIAAWLPRALRYAFQIRRHFTGHAATLP